MNIWNIYIQMLSLGPRHCWTILPAAIARPHRHACEVVSDEASKLPLKHKVQNIAGDKTKQSNAVPSYHDGMAEYSSSYFLSYDIGNILNLLNLSNISIPLHSSLTLAPQCPAFT